MKNSKMNTLLKFEEAAQFLLSIVLFNQLDYAWWIFPALLLLPDISMFAYLVNTKVGARIYNLFHHKTVALAVLILGFSMGNSGLLLAGTLLFGHSAMDRMFGYGLKFSDNFKNTHLGWIGNKADPLL